VISGFHTDPVPTSSLLAEFDVMLEAKVKDLALIRLRPDLLRYAPDVAARFGLSAAEAPRLEQEEAALLETEPDGGA